MPPDQNPLDYRTPTPPDPGRPNRWWKIVLRIMLGSIAGAASCILGVILINVTEVKFLGIMPFLLLLAGALYVSIRYRRFGYTSGVIIAPFLTVAALVLLLLWTCAHATPR